MGGLILPPKVGDGGLGTHRKRRPEFLRAGKAPARLHQRWGPRDFLRLYLVRFFEMRSCRSAGRRVGRQRRLTTACLVVPRATKAPDSTNVMSYLKIRWAPPSSEI